MKLKQIRLTSYRNIRNMELNFVPGVQVITGENAQGKTNILEAVFLTSTMRAFRTGKENMLIRYGEQSAVIETVFEKSGREQTLRIELFDKESKKVWLDGRRLQKTRDAIGLFQSVLFTPDHLMMIKGAPGERREFLDMTLCAQSPSYTEDLLQYSKALKNRNRLLKFEDEALLATLPVWDELLAKYGSRIAFARQQYIEQLTEVAAKEYAAISSDREKMKIVYVSPLTKENLTKEQYYTAILQALEKNKESDLENQSTGVGVHKDDFLTLLAGKSAKFYASQGQIRSCVLAIKMAEAALLEKNSGHKPVILLDDILSELDPGRQEYILNNTPENQCIVTACEPDKLKEICADCIWIEGGEKKDVSSSGR
ncbi:MAG: DNA replication/repair protein RecF [Clostridia bacterium]|nr:DNA replication/repair protein RecF [Clostridia bacterium]